MSRCRHLETIVQRTGPRDPWSGYTYCADCGESVGTVWKRKIDDTCDRLWRYRPHKTKPTRLNAGAEA